MKLNAFARESHPAFERAVLWKEFEREVVCASYVFRVARQSHPAERAFALAEERAYVFGHEAGNLECVGDSGVERLLAYVVGEHRLYVTSH